MIIQAKASIQHGDVAKFGVLGDDVTFFEVSKDSIRQKKGRTVHEYMVVTSH